LTRHAIPSRIWLMVVALGALAQSVNAQVPANSVAVKTYSGYYNDTAVYFTAFETNDVAFSAANGLVYAPRLNQVNAAPLPQMIFFMNGVGRQTVVLQTQPGQPDYNPLWQVVTALWTGTTPMPLISSFSSALQWAQQGQLLLASTGIIFNGPVFRVNRSLDLLDAGTLAPTISPGEFLGMDPSIRTAYFKVNQGYYAGQTVTFLALEHAPGQISHAPGAIPVPTINTNSLGSSGFANFYAVDGQLPVIDSIPVPQVSVTTAAGTMPASIVSGTASSAPATLYSPFWHVSTVTFNTGVQPKPLLSVQDIQQAATAGMVTVTAGQPDDAFNCPVPFYYQPGATGASPTTTPVYTPPTSTGGTPTTTPTSPGMY
jgi:hypothetical protein